MRRWLPWLAVGAAGVAGAAVLWWWTPPADPRASICALRRSFDLPCPGCGVTRALAALVRGDVGAAFALHPLALVLAVEAGLGWALAGARLLGRRPVLPDDRWITGIVAGHGVAFLALWLGRAATGSLPL